MNSQSISFLGLERLFWEEFAVKVNDEEYTNSFWTLSMRQ